MYIPKRWLVTGTLCLLFLVGIGVNLALTWHLRSESSPTEARLAVAAQPIPTSSDGSGPAPTDASAHPAATSTPGCAMSNEERAAFTAYVTAISTPPPPPPPPPPPVVPAGRTTVVAHHPATITVNDNATNSGIISRSQFNDGGFGDIGQQWRGVTTNAPVTNVHVSGSHNTTNVIIGNGNTVNTGPSTAAATSPPGTTTAATPTHPSGRTGTTGSTNIGGGGQATNGGGPTTGGGAGAGGGPTTAGGTGTGGAPTTGGGAGSTGTHTSSVPTSG